MQKLKATIKSILRPILLPIVHPILHRVRRFTGMRGELDNLNASWHQSMPGIVNAAASVAALAREQARIKREHETAIAQLKAAIDEMRRGTQDTSSRIIAADKVQRARSTGLKLILGSSTLDGYIRIDTHEAPGVDIVAPLDALPFAPAEVSEIVASHVLERFTPDELQRKVLPHWVSLLKPGGTLRAIVLDANAILGSAGLHDVQVIAEGPAGGNKAHQIEIAARVAAK